MKKTFRDKCEELERNGWQLVDYQPCAKKAVYTKGGQTKKVSGGA
jgi:hypothetical protein